LSKGWGAKRVSFGLAKLGISKELSAKALSDKEAFRDKLKEQAEKAVLRYKNKRNSYRKIIGYLLRKGFTYENISKQLEEINFKIDENQPITD
jgi:SOS response regulatory protein OraA/RecX